MVTADDPRYTDWSNRKPSKRKKLQNKILSAPGEYVKERATKVAEDTAKRAITGALRGGVAVAIARGGAAAALPAAAAAGGVASILAAAFLVGDTIARNQRVKLGDRLAAISNRFAQTQHQLEQAFGTDKWDGVPADVRSKAVRDYKAAIATATSQAQGSAFAGTRAEGSYK